MSRIGKQPIAIPAGVTITVDGNTVIVKGAKGELNQDLLPGISLTIDESVATVSRKDDEAELRARHGLIRSLINNMVVGVSQGFEKKLEINGVGYRVALAGTSLKMFLGYSHEVMYNLPEGVQAKVDQMTITISGTSKQLVGQVAAEIRALKKPEPYKGKGIKYVDERIIRKSGKSGKE